MKHLLICCLTIILFAYINLCKSQSLCNSDSLVYVATDKIPTCKNISAEELENRINQNIPLTDFNFENGKKFYVYLIINCKGEDINYKVYKNENEIFNKQIIECIQSNTEWTPAYIIGKGKKETAVDFGITLSFEVHLGKIVYLDNSVKIFKKQYYFIAREKQKKERKRR